MSRRWAALRRAAGDAAWWWLLHRDLYRLLNAYNTQFGRRHAPSNPWDLTARRLRRYWTQVRTERFRSDR
ncbi:hypothetical protein [Phaeacidiphilus oryzae]|uniref:hypothetical protein n=1 Tax=Phaeacidiphilus oryzae TaxID=348818 RepID=UPI00055D337F|nr:hypothetical protein [Phaeacidiphilus oryzae]